MVYITDKKLSAKERIQKEIRNKILVCAFTFLVLESVGYIIYDHYLNTLLSELIVVFCFVSGFFLVCFFTKLTLIQGRLWKKERKKESPDSFWDNVEYWGNVFIGAGTVLYSMILVFKIIIRGVLNNGF